MSGSPSQGPQEPASSGLPGGGRLGPFQLLSELGHGAFKTVYRARNLAASDNGLPEAVAVCVPHYQDEEGRQILRNEFRVAGSLDHPAIVRQYLVDESGGVLYAAVELVEGETIADRLRRAGPMGLEEAAAVVRQVGEALDYAHDGMAIHRDVKPANLMLVGGSAGPGGARVKVLDFGLARLMAHSQYLAGTRVGTVPFMAPEQFEGATGFGADLWALAVTFFQMVTNTLPFAARHEAELMRQILYEPPDLAPLEHAGLDRRLLNVLRKAFEKEPDKRYRRGADLAADLEAVLRHATTVNRIESEIEVLIRAHYPLLLVQTHEEERVLASLARVRAAMAAEGRERDLFVWSATRGLRDREGRVVGADTAGDPVNALEWVVRGPREGVYVFLDMHRHLTPVTVRQVRDAIWIVKRKHKSLVFLGPVARLPEELRLDATLLFYDPPDTARLRELVDEVAGGRAVDPEVRESLAGAVLGLTEREAERVLRRGLVRHGALDRGCLREALAEKRQIVRKEGVLEFCDSEGSLAEVGGLDLLKAWFASRRAAFAEAGRRFGLAAPRGAVLVGVPGCGKSLSAKALAAEWGVPLLRLDLGRVYASLVGEAESNLRRALRTAELVSPCVLWVDELEKAFSGLRTSRDSGVTQRLFGCFLTWLEDRGAPVFTIATANDISHLPPEFLRKGRFDEVFFVDLPDPREREDIFRIQLGAFRTPANGLDPQRFDLADLARQAQGFSGAEIREAVVSALYEAFDGGGRPLAPQDLAAELERTQPLSVSRAQDLARLRAWAGANARPAQGR